MGLELNTHVTFAPYCDTASVPSPTSQQVRLAGEILSVWIKRAHQPPLYLYIRVAHSERQRDRPQFAFARPSALSGRKSSGGAKGRAQQRLGKTSGRTDAGGPVVKICSGLISALGRERRGTTRHRRAQDEQARDSADGAPDATERTTQGRPRGRKDRTQRRRERRE